MKDIKKIIFVVFLALLFVPIAVKSLRLFDEKPLGGVYVKTEKPVLNDSTWFNGSFQSQQEKYLNENIGLHNTLVRIHNQLQFSLFSKTTAEKIIIGKENYLFENNYIFATTGSDFVGDGRIDTLMTKAVDAQKILNSHNIKLLFVFAPGKATYFSEYIPERYFVNGKSPKTNYSVLSAECDKRGLNNIDFNSWFLELKGKTEYPLFPKAGIHWSYYGMYLCADSLVKKTEYDLGKDIPELVLTNVELSPEQRNTEYDLGDLANLLLPINTYDLGYPTYEYKQEGKYRPKVLVIGDSFYWNMYYSGIPANVFKSLDFWYYNSRYYNDGTDKVIAEVANMDYIQEILKYEYIIILQTDGGLNNFGFGFFDKLISNYQNFNVPEGAMKYITSMKNDPKWLSHIEEKAKANGISLDEMIKRDAIYMYNQEQKK
jgi:hypothetical protein